MLFIYRIKSVPLADQNESGHIKCVLVWTIKWVSLSHCGLNKMQCVCVNVYDWDNVFSVIWARSPYVRITQYRECVKNIMYQCIQRRFRFKVVFGQSSSLPRVHTHTHAHIKMIMIRWGRWIWSLVEPIFRAVSIALFFLLALKIMSLKREVTK